jgi:predicted metal-dependent hydrolase
MLLSQPQSSENALKVKLVGVDCPLQLRRSKRARRFSLKVSHTERAAILTIPEDFEVEDAGKFLSRHMDWLTRQLDRLPTPIPFEDGAIVPLRGQPHRISFVGAMRYQGVVWVDESDRQIPAAEWQSDTICREENTLQINGNTYDTRDLPRICVSGGQDHGPRRLMDWLRNQAKADLSERTFHHAANLGCSAKRVTVRDQSTRWGSCSTTGTISYSWRLIFAPSEVLDYVAAHEVAHLREMNHGPRFWRLVRETMPGMQHARAWLKQNGAELHRFGATC